MATRHDLTRWTAIGDHRRADPPVRFVTIDDCDPLADPDSGAPFVEWARVYLADLLPDRALVNTDLTDLDRETREALAVAVAHTVAFYDGGSNFMHSLRSSWNKWGSLTIGQSRAVLDGLRTEGVRALPPVPIAFEADGVEITGFPKIRAMVDRARESLKRPTIRIPLGQDGEIRLKLAGDGSRNPGAIYVTRKINGEDPKYLGKIDPSGNADRKLSVADPSVHDRLRALEADPAGLMAREGRRLGACQFCARTLTEAGSLEVGYGPICAERYGLPHSQNGTAERPPVARAVPLAGLA